MRSVWLGAALVLVVVAAGPAWAEDPPPVVGATVMGDKGRTGPDGFVWAPVTRNQAPSGQAAGQNEAASRASPNATPQGGTPRLPPGQDPGTPAAPASGPGITDRPAGARTP